MSDKFDIFLSFYSAYLESNLQGYSFDIFFSFAGGAFGLADPKINLRYGISSTLLRHRVVCAANARYILKLKDKKYFRL